VPRKTRTPDDMFQSATESFQKAETAEELRAAQAVSLYSLV